MSDAKAYRLTDLTACFGGDIAGDPNTLIDSVGTVEGAGPSAITFLNQERLLGALRDTRAGAIIVAPKHRDVTMLPRIVCANPYAYFARVSALLMARVDEAPGIHPVAVVDGTAVIGANVSIGPHAVVCAGARIGESAVVGAHAYVGRNAVIGRDARLLPNSVVCHECCIGDRVILHPGAVIGADGFGNAFDEGRWVKVPQVGRVIIGNDVEIGANTTVDRGAMDDTVIEDGARLDNLVMVAHNVRIGVHTAIAACTGIAGSTRIGRYCRIGGAVGISGHLTIADNVEIAGKTFITKSITQAGSYSGGYPFEETAKWRRTAVRVRQLDDMARRIKEMEQRLKALEGK